MDEKVKIRNTENGAEVNCVLHRRTETFVEVIIGSGSSSMKVRLTPNRLRTAYVGTVMGREVVYEQSVKQVAEDIKRLSPGIKPSRRFNP